MMAGIINAVVRLLFLSCMIRSSVHMIFAQQSFGIRYSCKRDVVCYHIWRFSTDETADYISIVSNGEIQRAQALQDEDSKCTLRITPLSVGHHFCKRRPILLPIYSVVSNSLQLTLTPGKTVTLQCVLLTYIQQGHCYSLVQQHVSLLWVDETGAIIQQDSQHGIDQKSACDVTLTVAFLKPETKKYRCQATVDDQVLTSVEFRVRLQAPQGKGRIMIEEEPESQGQGRNHDTVGLAVGLVGCAVFLAVVVVFVVNRRRRSQQLPKETHYTTDTNNVSDADDVIYADIMIPSESNRVLVLESESSEYASVRYR
ncbi:uncharacterized protein LOC117824299 [Xyrichtys novacula]|uniref:Uncharacterized protein LOC117824299 n=1 Tax=Xyrichtys novacula TaxID=13765 RepID=A0AAV1GVU5_XYRNO|nr:uncharacterized protein LOC117824299 [Xyrichtys novacula]